MAREQFPKAAAFGALSFVLSLSRDKESTPNAGTAQREAVCASVEEVVGNLASPSAKNEVAQSGLLIRMFAN